jgi:hypothetical protein
MDSTVPVGTKIVVSIEFLEMLRLLGYPPPTRVHVEESEDYDSDTEIQFLE